MAAHIEKEPLSYYKILLLGKTGNGKSSVGNQILGRDEFSVACGINSETRYCCMRYAKRDSNTLIQIVDTPGVSDTHHNHEDILREISKFTATMSPGPDAILMVVSGMHRFTEEEYKAYLEAKKLFGSDVTERTIVVFTGGDELERKGVRIEDQIEKGSDNLKQMMKELNNRYVVINNNASEQSEKRKQVTNLFSNIESVSRSVETQTCTNQMFKDVDSLADQAAAKLSKEQKISREDARQEWNHQVMKVGTDQSPPGKEPYKFKEVKDRVKHETNKNKVVVKLCVIL